MAAMGATKSLPCTMSLQAARRCALLREGFDSSSFLKLLGERSDAATWISSRLTRAC